MPITPVREPGLLTDSPEDYAEKTQNWAEDIPRLARELDELFDSVLIVQERQMITVAGGMASAGTNNLRKIGTTIVNNIEDAVVNGSPNYLIQLPAGTYEIDAWGSAYSVGAHRIKVETTGGTFYGSSEVATSGASSKSHFKDRVTVTTGNLGFYHLVQNSIPSNGLGYPSGLGGDEIYAQIKITKV